MAKLVFDVVGEDREFYLSRGYDVVGVDRTWAAGGHHSDGRFSDALKEVPLRVVRHGAGLSRGHGQ